MIKLSDRYFQINAISNSDFTKLQDWTNSRVKLDIDLQPIFNFGSLVDGMLTQPELISYSQRTLIKDNKIVKFNKTDFDLAERIKSNFLNNSFCLNFLKNSSFQKVFYKKMQYTFKGKTFVLTVKCMWDFWQEYSHFGAELKTTYAKTKIEYLKAIDFMDIDRQVAFYMDIAGTDTDVIIGISKKTDNVFTIPITRDSEIYKRGKQKYLALAFHWYLLFGGDKF